MSVATPLRSIVEATRQEHTLADYVPQHGLSDHHADDHYRPRRGVSSATDRARAAEAHPARMLEPTPTDLGSPGRRAYSGWKLGVLGEQPVAEELDRLIALDPRWSYLSFSPAGTGNPGVGAAEVGDADIDHLVVGPGGVFTITARHHHACTVWVSGDALVVNGSWKPYVHDSRDEAERASTLLSSTAQAPITVTGLVVPVGIADLTVAEQPADVRVVDGARLVDFLTSLPAVLDGYAVALVVTCARLSTTWRPGLSFRYA